MFRWNDPEYLQYYSQRHRWWANAQIGRSGLPMWKDGCLVTVVAYDISRTLDEVITPFDFLVHCNANDGFTPEGLLKWSMVEQYTKGKLKYAGTSLPRDKKYTIHQVMWGHQSHFVAKVPGPDQVLDPWDGMLKNLKQPQWSGPISSRYLH